MTRHAVALGLVLLATTACSFADAPDEIEVEDVGVAQEELTASAPALPKEVEQFLARQGSASKPLLGRLFKLEHFVPLGAGRKIHVTETFTLRAFLRSERRAILMLPGPLTQGSFFNIEVDGYQGRDRLAKRGFFALTADFEGSGQSSYPANGRTPDQNRHVENMRKVIQYFRLIRLLPKVDVLGESWGGGVAAELCADSLRVRSCLLGSMLYKTPSEFANLTFRSPEFRGFLDSFPDGYFATVPDTYAGLVASSPPAVRAWAQATQPGRYTTVPLYDVFDLPFFDPTLARVPGRIIQGEFDPNQPASDAEELANDYDSAGADVVVVPGAGHIPRVEGESQKEAYWTAVEQFIDP